MTTLTELEKLADTATPGPWRYEPRGQMIMGRSVGGCQMKLGDHMVADVRGWGHLQYLPNGAEIQDATGEFIAAANPATIKKLIALVRLQHEVLVDERYVPRYTQVEEAIKAYEEFEK